MSNRQTDNSFFASKVNLRLRHLPDKQHIRVLDAFGGDGRIWNKIKTLTDKKIDVLRIDRKDTSKGIYLRGENVKYLKSLDLTKYDVIDLDAYGTPYEQLEIVFNSLSANKTNYEIVCFVTFIQTMLGALPRKLLYRLGYTKQMVEKIPTLFSMKGFEKLKRYLYLRMVRRICSMSSSRKHYLCFKLKKYKSIIST